MELTLENKIAFFTLYYGQRVRYWTVNGALKLCKNNTFSKSLVQYSSIFLTPLSSITDEDALFICEMSFRDLSSYDDQAKIAMGKRLIDSVVSDEASYFSGALCCAINDVLRSKSYALPWMGMPLKQMVEAGWIKLKES